MGERNAWGDAPQAAALGGPRPGAVRGLLTAACRFRPERGRG